MLHVALVVAGFVLIAEKESISGTRMLSRTYSLISDDDTSTGYVRAEWTFSLNRAHFTESVEISEPQISINRLSIADPIQFLEGDSRAANEICSLYRQIDSHHLGHYSYQWSDWHNTELKRIQLAGFSGKVTRFNYARAITWYGLLTAAGLSAVYFVGSWHIRRRVTAHLRAIHAAICPSCAYEIDRRVSQICPECGLRLDREAKLIELLHYGGYRGLKRFQKLDEEGAWKS